MLPKVPVAVASSCSGVSCRHASNSRSFIIVLCRKNSTRRSMPSIVATIARGQSWRDGPSLRSSQHRGRPDVEVPLTPLEFARRTRRLHSQREAVVDDGLRLSYAELFDRCDRWSSALSELGLRQGDRVAYIAPNTHAQLESFFAVPQIGGVLVPINYRLTADDFAYLINHSGAKVVCAHRDYLDAVDGVRSQLKSVENFVSLDDARDG